MNEFVTGGTWEPERIKWDHPKIESYIKDHWKEESDKELAESLSEMTGKNITKIQARNKRRDMGIDRSDYVRRHMDIENAGPEGQVDWNNPEVIKYIQTRYQDKNDLEIARGLSERFDADVSWTAARKHRLDMGYKREPSPKTSKFELGVPKYRKFIYEHHPNFQGEGEINDFLIKFYEKFDPHITLRSLKRRMRQFIRNDGAIKLMKKINRSKMDLGKIERWLNLP